MQQQVMRKLVLPAAVPIGIAVVTGLLIFGIGEALLHLFDEGVTSEFKRVELWSAVFFSLAILFVAGFLATRPPGSLGPLDEELAIGKRPLLAPPLPAVDISARRGPLGVTKDIKPGFILYARNGALAQVTDVLTGVQEQYGHLRRGLIYAQGLHGADDELWIPVEAISAVYPDTESAFLAIAGDETAALGWNRPPAAFSRNPQREEQKLY